MKWGIVALGAACGFAVGVPSASALTVGTVVTDLGSHTAPGTVLLGNNPADPYSADFLAAIAGRGGVNGEVIRYYIDLNLEAGESCTYGVDCGTSVDVGNGGTGIEYMYLRFHPVTSNFETTLNIIFDDLDLAGVNDPPGFLETVEIFDSVGTSVAMIANATHSLVQVGTDSDIQLLALSLTPASSPTWVKLGFTAAWNQNGRNTAEYLWATMCNPGEPGCSAGQSLVPLPAALPLFATAMGALGLVGWRRRRTKT